MTGEEIYKEEGRRIGHRNFLKSAGIATGSPLAVECERKSIQTVEGIAADPKWTPLIDAYCTWDAMQCGYCTPGIMVSSPRLSWTRIPTRPKRTSSRHWQAISAAAGPIRGSLPQSWKQHRR
jgi:hypothetical protein